MIAERDPAKLFYEYPVSLYDTTSAFNYPFSTGVKFMPQNMTSENRSGNATWWPSRCALNGYQHGVHVVSEGETDNVARRDFVPSATRVTSGRQPGKLLVWATKAKATLVRRGDTH